MTRLALLALLLFSLVVADARADVATPLDGDEHLNIGVRIGWDTDNGDMLWGFEASYTFRDELVHGPVMNLDFGRSATRIGLGYEVTSIDGDVLPPTLGLEIGPSVILGSDGVETGAHATVFIGGLLFLYDQLTLMPSGITNDFGFILKAPIPTSDYPPNDEGI